ncbi:MAG: DUF4249 family protein [Bacteroidales bacterium]|nr:DUF4249 family protein [Bacteroidales bacterium]
MKRNSRLFTWSVGLLLALTGCVQPVEIEPPAEREVFVKCILERGNYTHRVTVLYSGGIGDERFVPVTNAVVNLGEGKAYASQHIEGFYQFKHIGSGVYEGQTSLKDGATYYLTVVIPGRDTLEATTTMPPAYSISSLVIPPEEWLEDGNENRRGMNPWAYGVWYESLEQMKESGGRSLLTEMPGLLFQFDSLAHHHFYILGRMEDATGVVAPIARLATNHRLVDNVNATKNQYRIDVSSDLSDANPKQRYDRLIKQHYEGLALHNGYLRVDSPEDFDNGMRNIYRYLFPHFDVTPEKDQMIMDATRFFTVVGDFDYNYWEPYDREVLHPVLYFCSVSEEYDRYLRSVQASIVDAEGDVLSTLYGDAAGYSNIKGGYGVFGAVSTLRHDCDVQEKRYFSRVYISPYDAYPALLPEL